MPVYGDKDLLLQLQGTLLQEGYERADPAGDALFGTADDLSSSGGGNIACCGDEKGKAAAGKRSRKMMEKIWKIIDKKY